MKTRSVPDHEPRHCSQCHGTSAGSNGRQYIASYEVHVDGHAFWWGYLALHLVDGDALLQDPQALLDALCARAAGRHDVAAVQVRLVMISRL